MKHLAFTLAALSLSACQIADPSGGVLEVPKDYNPQALVGRTLIHEDGNLTVNPDGTIGGEIQGTWEIQGPDWCRTITKPEKYAGTVCRPVSVTGNTATFVREDGYVYTMTLK
ncbi:hypothetical protein [Pelagimonas varians]|uniref:Lipoprotein n=1 Tax=Pelagimonas varians TaxID=696760 RepID=A0A238JY78_9RHOB|nr:hypothetical protein [Pelagimonas varians]PYG33075.1 hypothetical protein C8N36_10269 [Pelagimonas varians]SMX35605.1 hypothetical protein PEV8663_00531 [Pelagimonas varians]